MCERGAVEAPQSREGHVVRIPGVRHAVPVGDGRESLVQWAGGQIGKGATRGASLWEVAQDRRSVGGDGLVRTPEVRQGDSARETGTDAGDFERDETVVADRPQDRLNCTLVDGVEEVMKIKLQ